MSSLLRSIAGVWENNQTLCALLPFDRVFTGRVPGTELYRFPYVSIMAGQGSQYHRSDKNHLSFGPLSFHIWVDDARLEYAETVADAIMQVYADRCWPISDDARVIDVLDEGEPMAHQTDLPNVKAWEVVKLFTVCVERDRVDHSEEDGCCTSSYSDDQEESSSSSSGQ